MKVMVLFLSLVVAIQGGVLAFTFLSGRAPFSEQILTVEPVEAPEKSPVEQSEMLVRRDDGMIDELIRSLKSERQEVAEEKLQLDKREKNLQELHASYLKVRQVVEQLQKNLETQLVKVDKNQDKNFKTLADVYAKMDPSSSARALQQMDPERAAQILSRMDSRAMAAVMDSAVATSPDGGESVALWSDAIRRLSQVKGEASL